MQAPHCSLCARLHAIRTYAHTRKRGGNLHGNNKRRHDAANNPDNQHLPRIRNISQLMEKLIKTETRHPLKDFVKLRASRVHRRMWVWSVCINIEICASLRNLCVWVCMRACACAVCAFGCCIRNQDRLGLTGWYHFTKLRRTSDAPKQNRTEMIREPRYVSIIIPIHWSGVSISDQILAPLYCIGIMVETWRGYLVTWVRFRLCVSQKSGGVTYLKRE